jgi:hypothetical protein
VLKMALKFLNNSIKLETTDIDTLVLITYYFGLHGGNKLIEEKYRDRLIKKIEDYAETNPRDTVIPSQAMLDMYNKTRIIKKSYKRNTMGVNRDNREEVIISSRDENEIEEVFSINDYVVNIKFGYPVLLPKDVINFIKSIKMVTHKKDALGNIIKQEISRYFVEKVYEEVS